MAESTKTVRALEKGLQIVRHLQANNGLSLHDLYQQTAIPKPTLLRLLSTLQAAGFAWQGLGDKLYHASETAAASTASQNRRDSHLAEVAGPALDQLVTAVRWPSDLSVRHGLHMALLETSRRRSYFTLNRLAVGFRISMLASAPGRAYLAFCSDTERSTILRQLQRAQDPWWSLLGRDTTMLMQELTTTRERGYAIRDTRWGGHATLPKHVYDDGLMAIAVPIVGEKRILGCVNLVWIRRVTSTSAIVARHLADLQKTALAISEFHRAARKLSRQK